ncbi:MAG: PaaI family thioesterase [Armatimonadetes bacterium]|nr:PaaI family thioesterase [Armatimonadota bacterium]MCX7969338.1 PaaI family thioesterase [Armatimonadota bacterium]MDW8142604.1 PaaI family thioesterase [Armatimonadota bacterium]
MAKSEQVLPYYKHCFVCGETRLGRLGLRFKVVNGIVRATFTPTEKHVGFPGVVHVGIITALLDEAMLWAIYATTGQFALSQEITVRFLKPLPVGRKVLVIGYLVRRQRKLFEVASELQDEQAVVYARSWGRFVPASAEENEQWLNALQPAKT